MGVELSKLSRFDLLGEYDPLMLPCDDGDYVRYDDVVDLIEALQSGEPVVGTDCVQLPTNVDQARAMAIVGTNWLKDHAPDQLIAPQPVVPQALIEKVTALCAVVENDEELPPIKWALKCNGLINEVKALLIAGKETV
jgi:hypothetical protein